MDALQTVFNTIMDVLNIIKGFLAQLFPAKDEAEGDAEANA